MRRGRSARSGRRYHGCTVVAQATDLGGGPLAGARLAREVADDFATPDKSKPKTLPSAVRHFGWSDDEVGAFYQPETQVASKSLIYF